MECAENIIKSRTDALNNWGLRNQRLSTFPEGFDSLVKTKGEIPYKDNDLIKN